MTPVLKNIYSKHTKVLYTKIPWAVWIGIRCKIVNTLEVSHTHTQIEMSGIKCQLNMVFAFTLVVKPYIYIWLWHQCNGGQPKALRVKINEPPEQKEL